MSPFLRPNHSVRRECQFQRHLSLRVSLCCKTLFATLQAILGYEVTRVCACANTHTCLMWCHGTGLSWHYVVIRPSFSIWSWFWIFHPFSWPYFSAIHWVKIKLPELLKSRFEPCSLWMEIYDVIQWDKLTIVKKQNLINLRESFPLSSSFHLLCDLE